MKVNSLLKLDYILVAKAFDAIQYKTQMDFSSWEQREEDKVEFLYLGYFDGTILKLKLVNGNLKKKDWNRIIKRNKNYNRR